ncbi:MAG: hypothetical protein HPY50_18560 [Firmicutes bacterium]|nr:hypothetical protein [Bacillota bacterium]
MGGKEETRAYKIQGMTCEACEGRIKKALEKIPGVKRVQPDYRRSILLLERNPGGEIDSLVAQELENLGYRIVPSRHGLIRGIIGLVIVGMVGGLIFLNGAGTGFFPEINQSMGLGIVFMAGLLTSVHCIAMCGGLVISQTANRREELRQNPLDPGNGGGERLKSRLGPSFSYNLGRIVSYTVIGGLAGALGAAVSLTGGARGLVVIVSGALVLLIGANLLGFLRPLRHLIPRVPGNLVARVYGWSRGRGPLVIGLLNGMMPCGPLQAMQIYALSTGSWWLGAASMLVFGLGTLPLLFAFGVINTLLSGGFSRWMVKASGVLMCVMGIVMLSRGLALSGAFVPSLAGNLDTSSAPIVVATGESREAVTAEPTPTPVPVLPGEPKDPGKEPEKRVEPQKPIAASQPKAEPQPLPRPQPEEAVQVVRTVAESGAYLPRVQEIKKGVKVRWIIDGKSLNGCNRTIVIPRLNLKKQLSPGENVIEFTPQSEGTLGYSCWMGMITGAFKVVG